ncbi:uncharacterized protein BX664DRAFT_367317 [Halteromyces radiatus]|uniref:uncharacterized protein n=1 Tax=Halteromyces radiatus TaxID=101107 RepID=UPI00221E46C8|nr:uncharacterized protein BX664DRAFT_367317 [Halteromyces radiatus]KAI8077857.1 hypothetical protein BX664DRAFT_367317 [Halteromyces radiatus]
MESKPEKPDFASDPRMTFNEQTGKWSFVGEDEVSYEYDENMNAWFPMYDEKLVAKQQSAYAVEGVDEQEPVVKTQEKKKRVYTYTEGEENNNNKKPKREPTKKINTSVYVTGVPPDVTIDELKQVFSKCGVIMEDLETGEPKIKIYRDDHGISKGDALVTYFKEESISLAINLLDDSELRPGEKSTKINVQPAVFKEKDPSEKKKPQQPPKNKIKKKLHQLNRKLDWVEEEAGKKSEKFSKIVILKNMYTQQELDDDPTLLLELKQDVREECEKLGEVTNVILYDVSI